VADAAGLGSPPLLWINDGGETVNKKSFGLWIKTRRRSLGLSLGKCALRAGVSAEALRLIEGGKTNPADCRVATLYGLAKILRFPIAEMIEMATSADVPLRVWLLKRWP